MKNTVHFIFQGKGGIGKSLVATLLAQYFQKKAPGQTMNFDTDQENTTFANYKALNVEHVPVMSESRTVNAKMFDGMMEAIATKDGIAVIDNGSNTFSPLLSYMVENDIVQLLKDSGKTVYLHVIVGGGDTLRETAQGFNSMVQGINAPIVLWLNEYFGPTRTPEGKHFAETKVYRDNEDRIKGVVMLPARNQQTYGDDIKKMNTRRLTIDEVVESPDFSLLEKQRLKTVAREVSEQLDKIEF